MFYLKQIATEYGAKHSMVGESLIIEQGSHTITIYPNRHLVYTTLGNERVNERLESEGELEATLIEILEYIKRSHKK